MESSAWRRRASSDAEQPAQSQSMIVKCEPVELKVESGWGHCGVSEAAVAEGLYTGHKVKDELVFGPDVVLQQDIAVSMQNAQSRMEEDPCKPKSEGGADAASESPGDDPHCSRSTEQHELRNYFVRLEQLPVGDLRSAESSFFCKRESFIEKVRLYPCLWDMNHESFRDIARKDLAWEHIATEYGMANGKEAKLQWKKLRDSHREAMRRRKTTGHGQNTKSWKYEAVMSFLLPQSVNSSNSINSLDNTLNNNTTAVNVTSESQNPTTESKPHAESISPVPPVSSLPPPRSPIPPATTNQTRHKTKQNRALAADRDKRREQRQIERDGMRRKMLDSNRAQDALSNMFTSFCQKTRQLPKYLQIRVERQIFDIVSRAEEEAMTLDSVNSPPTSTSTYEHSTGTVYRTSPLPDN